MKTLLTLGWLLLASHFASAAMITGVLLPAGSKQSDLFPKGRIRMDIAFDNHFHSFAMQKSGFDVHIFCSWTNIGRDEVRLLLKDHDNYSGTLDYPWGIEARVTRTGGGMITENTTEKNGWWSSSNIQSEMSELMPGDALVLKPGETVVRSIPLQSVLFGLDLNPADKGPSAGELYD